MNNGKEKWADAIERARELFNQGWKELGDAAELAKEKGEDAFEEAQKRGREVWTNARARGMETWVDAKERGLESFHDAQDRGEELVKDAEKLVRKHPSKAIGLSVLVGLFIGALMSRDRD
jgi:ElaB/YqjD/DUF883 family membrane-anchored ribosome-binding protein